MYNFIATIVEVVFDEIFELGGGAINCFLPYEGIYWRHVTARDISSIWRIISDKLRGDTETIEFLIDFETLASPRILREHNFYTTFQPRIFARHILLLFSIGGQDYQIILKFRATALGDAQENRALDALGDLTFIIDEYTRDTRYELVMARAPDYVKDIVLKVK